MRAAPQSHVCAKWPISPPSSSSYYKSTWQAASGVRRLHQVQWEHGIRTCGHVEKLFKG